jgi:phage-related protein
MSTRLDRAAAAVGGMAIAAACVVGCAQTKEAAKDVASSAASVGSSAASVAGSAATSAGSAASSAATSVGSAASSGASAASSAATSVGSAASSAVSSVLNRAPEAVQEAPGKAAEKSGRNWWWIPIGIALAALLAGLLRKLTRRTAQSVNVAVQRAPEVKTTRVVTDPTPKQQASRRPVDDDRDRLND